MLGECISLKNLSIKEIEYKLICKGVNKEIIEDYIYENKDKLEEYEIKSASNLVNKKQKIMEKEDIYNYLIKKGYKHQTIKEVL